MSNRTNYSRSPAPAWPDPDFDEARRIRDACGVGVVADIKGRRSHRIVEQGIEVLRNLDHRGARNADPDTGDGAGILIQMPDAFFRAQTDAAGFSLPATGGYAVGMVFLPRDGAERSICEAAIERIVVAEEQSFLGWRDVPVRLGVIGRIAEERRPCIRQFFIASTLAPPDAAAFERKLYLIRKVIERAGSELGITGADDFYACSLSANRIVYKGMLTSLQLDAFYPDLSDPSLVSCFAMVHSRFSTNTLGSWKLAHPYRHVVHNGEINTLRGNFNWMHARQAMLASPDFGADIEKLFPIIQPHASDTACFDNALELLIHTGRSLPHALMMMIPEAWENHDSMSQAKRDFYHYHAALMEPWDGPALIAATDGTRIAAILDRNGLRPFRYTVTHEDLLVMGSETGVLDIPPADIAFKGRLSPGRMFLVDTAEGRIIGDEELKQQLATRKPYGRWLRAHAVALQDLDPPPEAADADPGALLDRQRAFGYTVEDVNVLIRPMAEAGAEPVGSMGNDAPLAVLSDQAPPLFSYFKQLFAQVSNPPLDAIREELVTSLATFIGSERNLFEETPEHCRQLRLPSPTLTNRELAQIKRLDRPGLRASTLPIVFERDGADALQQAMDALLDAATRAVADGATILVLSDRAVDADHVPIPSLLATAGVHHRLIREGTRTQVGLVVESGEPREVHHFALLLGYGAGAVNPYLAYETVAKLARDGSLNGAPVEHAQAVYLRAVNKGVLKTMSKMGISTLQSYRGAQIFEAIGLDRDLVDRYFSWTPSRIAGIGLTVLEREARERHARGFPARGAPHGRGLTPGGQYQWIRGAEHHMYNADTIAKLQYAATHNDRAAYREFAELSDREDRRLTTIRGLLEFRPDQAAVPLDQVEPAVEIVKRFSTGAISLGAISKEAHETLAVAMNRIGGRSNTGEGGEDHRRFKPDPDGDRRNSAIKQVASGRFGVTPTYLVNASDLQIKMAQGAKPGEGGQLPGWKIDEYIGWIRHTLPGVELISPPPHHDIYSIEDLAQLIHDLKNANPAARIHVKLVAEVGVGTIAAGVAKAHGDVVLISGDSGGTGASPLSSIKHAGLPWELGLAETQQILVENELRGRIVVQTDGQLKTGRDVAIACLLGADEFGFATAPLVVLGCVMLRNCHLNTCSVGVATQDPELRKRFAGTPEALVNYFIMVAEHLRQIMAELGFRTVGEMVGRVEYLQTRAEIDHWKGRGLDLSSILRPPQRPPNVAIHQCELQDHGLDHALDNELIRLSRDAIEHGRPVRIDRAIRNSNRTVCTMLSSEIAKRYGEEGLPDGTIVCRFTGSAGQSFGAFLAPGLDVLVRGDANDYFGKGMAGGRIVLRPAAEATFVPEQNVIAGNVILYGATGGKLFIRGQVGERFGVRNSGAQAVVEGVADHACEYMTSGVVVVIGPTGRNFAAGMSGGLAFVHDPAGEFPARCNLGMVEFEDLSASEDRELLESLLREHLEVTDSPVAARLLDRWPACLTEFVKVMPRDYKRVLAERAARSEEEQQRAMELILNG